jgi:hypothetical protein
MRMRGELAGLFDIWPPDFTCKHLRELRGVPRSRRWEPISNDMSGIGNIDHGASH